MNTLNESGIAEELDNGDSSKAKAEKGGEYVSEAPDVEQGHLQEIEVDVDRVMHDEGVKDLEADTSPYPEGLTDKICFLTSSDTSHSASGGPGDG